ncbi:MAG: hypothetical protein KTR27_09825 [Leptolyngbyaceae cyanobacterium MAG.088]|nr:hypothetical protein [Leptolyngbyaceae cyanobacterium MAG.088]
MNSYQALSLLRWRRLCLQFGIDDQTAIELEFKRITTAYAELHRAYHNVQHINECLDLLDWAMEATPIPWESRSLLEFALWYHDVVYQPQAPDNERQSADQAIAFLQTNGVEIDQIHCVESLIMATCHFIEPEPGEMAKLAGWMLDIDLAILGTSAQRFSQYNEQIRQEYAWVSEQVYRTKRKALLAQFLDRPVIYHWPLFQERFECQARHNLSTMVSVL